MNNDDTINNNSFINIKNLIKSYDDGKIKALNGIDLEINKGGDFISIIGPPSGSGKSTLLNMLGGALDIPSSGTIKIDGGVEITKSKDLSQFRSKKSVLYFNYTISFQI